jgi:prepilin-type N-terminal cleavage/methylation domain-containing protein
LKPGADAIRLVGVKRAGFTLVEVMVAAAIVLVGVAGMVQAVAIGTESLDTTRKQQVAAQLAAGEIEQLRNSAWAVIANLPASATISINAAGAISGDVTQFALSNRTATAADDDTALSARARGFTCSLTATRLRPESATASTVTFVRVTYTVTWTSAAGRTHRRTTEAFLGMNGLHLSHQQA